MENTVYVLHQGEVVLFEGCEEDVRERIETLLEENTGVWASLQEEIDEEYTVCLHSDNWDDMEDEEFDNLQNQLGVELGDDEAVDVAIKKLLNIRVTEKQTVSN